MKRCLLAFALVAILATSVAADINVSGEGTANLVPDLARVTLGVVTEAEKPDAALAANNEAVTLLFGRLEIYKITSRDIQTTGLSINPRYNKEDKVDGYIVSNQVTVCVRNLKELGLLLHTVVIGGVNRIQGIQFDASDPREAADQARVQAVRDARHKADLLAKTAGAKVGKVLEINESVSTPRIHADSYRAASVAPGGSVPMAAGQLTVRVQVTVRYTID